MMQRFTLFTLFIWFQTLLYSQDNKKLRIQHLTDNFYVYTTYKDLDGTMFPSNSMYLVTNAGVVLLTHPGTPPNFSRFLIVFRAGIMKKSFWLLQHIIMMTEQQALSF